MTYEPTEAQRLMTQHLLDNPLAVLFCGMGLGKTAATLEALDILLTDCLISGVLIVAPLRVATLTWPTEIGHWGHTRWLKVANLRTPQGKQALLDGSAQIYMINFEMLQQLAKFIKDNKLRQPPFQAVVIDELSMAKDPKSKRIRAIAAMLWKQCPIRWGLTGTLMPNSRMDLFAQYRLIDTGERLGKSYTQFKDNYFKPIDYNGYKWVEREGAQEQIEARIKDITLSLRTSEWMDLPDLIEEDVMVKLDGYALETYKAMEKEFLVTLKSGSDVIALNSAVQVMKLLQCTSGSIYTDEEGSYERIHSVKVTAVSRLLKNCEGNTLVVYNFKHELEQLVKHIPEGVRFYDADLDDWNSGKIRVMFCHPKSMSHGLNLQHGGQNIIWVTPTYSREGYDQLNARLSRRGQQHVTRIYRVLAEKTIDLAVIDALERKGSAQSNLIESLKSYAN